MCLVRGYKDFTLPVTIEAVTIETLPVNIAAQTIPKLAVDIVGQSVGPIDVNIVGQGAPISVTISGQTVDVNIKTSSGANIVIDKLTQGAYTERRFRMENNGETADMIGDNLTYKKAKFFARGARGYIGLVEVYCDNLDTVAHVLTLKVSPQPGMAPLYTRSLTVPARASAGWRSVFFSVFWNYDSLFIWVSSDSDSYGRIGYDTGEPCDGYVSSDEASWTPLWMRFWIRVGVSGGTVGDIPVSGTVNTIEVPSSATLIDSGIQRVNGGTTVTLVDVTGPGRVDGLVHNVWIAAGNPGAYNDYMVFVIDDATMQLNLAYLAHLVNYRKDTVSPFSIVEYDSVNGIWGVAFNVPLHFRRRFQFKVYNSAVPGNDFHSKCVAVITLVR